MNMKIISIIFICLFISNCYACKFCKKTNIYLENQYENYKDLLESDIEFNRLYIEGKADAYRESLYYHELFIYR